MADIEDLDAPFEQLLLDSDAEVDAEAGNESDDSDATRILVDDSSDEDTSSDEEPFSADEWSNDVEPANDFHFADRNIGWSSEVHDAETPLEHYMLFVEEILAHTIVETNRYGRQKVLNWRDTDKGEFTIFLGLCIKMGIIKLPTLRDYWNRSGDYGEQPICAKWMIRARFEEILGAVHLNDNDSNPGRDRLHKIRPVIDIFNEVNARLFRPGRKVCIDESLVPFRGRTVFRQYIPNKRHRYGIKLFKLCSEGGYTWKTQIYAGKDETRQGSVADAVVMKLMDELLDQGRTLFVDNWYTSVGLAEKMVDRTTNMVGTLRKNRKGVPVDVKGKKLKKGQLVAQQNKKGVMVLKWKDKRELYMLSAIHDASRAPSGKPTVVHAYNEGKMFVDTSDQMASYTPFVRKTCKWYLRLFFHLVTQTALVNSWKLYCHQQGTIKLNDYKVKLCRELLSSDVSPPSSRHVLELAGPARTARKRCINCYHSLAKSEASAVAAKKAKQVNTRCSSCQKPYCLDCFGKKHRRCS